MSFAKDIAKSLMQNAEPAAPPPVRAGKPDDLPFADATSPDPDAENDPAILDLETFCARCGLTHHAQASRRDCPCSRHIDGGVEGMKNAPCNAAAPSEPPRSKSQTRRIAIQQEAHSTGEPPTVATREAISEMISEDILAGRFHTATQRAIDALYDERERLAAKVADLKQQVRDLATQREALSADRTALRTTVARLAEPVTEDEAIQWGKFLDSLGVGVRPISQRYNEHEAGLLRITWLALNDFLARRAEHGGAV